MMSVFQRLQKGCAETRWVHSEAQIADSLTKPVANSSLIRVLHDGVWTLVHDPSFTSAKKLKLRLRAEDEVSAKVFGASESDSLKTSDLPPPDIFAHIFLSSLNPVDYRNLTAAIGDQSQGTLWP